jgi:chromosomal replication initiation ATPase DnaA
MVDAQSILALGFRRRRALGRADFVVSESNAAAAAAVADPAAWPGGRLALIGPAGAGKTHLARVLMVETGAAGVDAAALRVPDAPALVAAGAAVVVEDADRTGGAAEAEQALFHLLNLAAAEGRPVLLTGRTAPARWPAALPDLASRLAALPVAEIGAPDDALLEAVITKLFADRDLPVEAGLPAYLARRIERSFSAAAAAVDRLDAASLARKGRITRKLAAEALG